MNFNQTLSIDIVNDKDFMKEVYRVIDRLFGEFIQADMKSSESKIYVKVSVSRVVQIALNENPSMTIKQFFAHFQSRMKNSRELVLGALTFQGKDVDMDSIPHSISKTVNGTGNDWKTVKEEIPETKTLSKEEFVNLALDEFNKKLITKEQLTNRLKDAV
jgi:hypothetical protein